MILKKFFKCGAVMFLLVIINTDLLFKLHVQTRMTGLSLSLLTRRVSEKVNLSIPVYTASLTNVHSKTLTSELSYR